MYHRRWVYWRWRAKERKKEGTKTDEETWKRTEKEKEKEKQDKKGDVVLLLKNQAPYSYNYHAPKESTICIS